MKISFVRTANETLASMRYRILIPMEALIELGHDVDLVDSLPVSTSVLIFSKHFNKTRDYDMILAAKEKGIKTVYDVCDNHYNTQHSAYYRDMTSLAKIVTCNTPEMAKVILQETGRIAKIVDDPHEYKKKAPEFRYDGGRIKVLWYGHSSNLNTIPVLLNDLSKLPRDSHLRIISNAGLNIKNNIDKVKVECSPWSQGIMETSMNWADIIAIPSIVSDETKRTKSHNRVTEAIMFGKMVVAHPLPSYERYRPFIWVGDNLGQGIEWVMRNPKKNLELIEAAQMFIEATLSPVRIADSWVEAING